MLRDLGWSKVWSSFWITLLAAISICAAFGCLDSVPANIEIFSPGWFAEIVPVALVCFLGVYFVKGSSLFIAHEIITEGTLPISLRPEIERPDRPWRGKRTPLRHLEGLKRELTAVEERIELLATIDAYIRYYKELAAQTTRIGEEAAIVSVFEESRDHFTKCFGGDKERAAELIERIDYIFGGDVAGDIRALEERLDDLRYQRGQMAPESTATLHKMDIAITACERDITELKNWQTLQQGTGAESSPQRQRFDHAKTVEYDNERIQIWARYAKFKAYEEQLAMKKEEMEKIQKRVAQGELTKSDAAYLLQKLDEYFGDNDDRIFA